MSKILVFILACIFIAVGTWLYRNPRKLTPSWWLGANSGAQKDLAKFLGIAMVFVGTANLIFCIAGILVGEFTQVILALLGAPTITWMFFRHLRRQSQ